MCEICWYFSFEFVCFGVEIIDVCKYVLWGIIVGCEVLEWNDFVVVDVVVGDFLIVFGVFVDVLVCD